MSKHQRFVLICLLWHFTLSRSMYSGSWCPYQVEKLIPCRVRNGTESYYGPKICWKSINGSYSCTKKILYRPKFAITYKKIFETKYKCCPGLEGSDCQDECFNCTSYQNLIHRVTLLETKLDTFNEESNRHFLTPQPFIQEGLLHDYLHSGEIREQSLTFIALNTRISSLMNEFKDMESRIRSLEEEVFRLSSYNHQSHIPRETSQPLRLGEPHPQTKSIQATTTPYVKDRERKQQTNTDIFMKHLEDNLERGDIASTINDDYGEEILFENSTEQYIDPLHKDF